MSKDTIHGRIKTDETTFKTMFNGSDSDAMSITVGPLTMDFARATDEHTLEGETSLVMENGDKRGHVELPHDVLENHFRKLMWEYHTESDEWTNKHGRVVDEVDE
jgi:hypothetical protein